MGGQGERWLPRTADETWALLARVLAFVLGAFLLVREQEQAEPRLWMLCIGLACLGPTVAATAASVLQAAAGVIQSGKGGGDPPDTR